MRPAARRFHLLDGQADIIHRMLTIVGFGQVRISNSGVSALRVFACGRGIAHSRLLSGIECVQAHHDGANSGGCGAPVRHLRLRIIFRSSFGPRAGAHTVDFRVLHFQSDSFARTSAGG